MNFMRYGLPVKGTTGTAPTAGREYDPKNFQNVFFTVREGRRQPNDGCILSRDPSAAPSSIASCIQSAIFSRDAPSSHSISGRPPSALNILMSGGSSSALAHVIFPSPPISDVVVPSVQSLANDVPSEHFERSDIEEGDNVRQSPPWTRENPEYLPFKRPRLQVPIFPNSEESPSDRHWDQQSFFQIPAVAGRQQQENDKFQLARPLAEEDFVTPRRPTATQHFEFFSNSVARAERSLQRLSTPTPRRMDPLEPGPSSSKFDKSETKMSNKKTGEITAMVASTALSETTFSVVALTEGRGSAVGEVGLAAIDLRNPVLTLCQMSDYETYPRVMAKTNVFNPVELIVPDTIANEDSNSDLYKALLSSFHHVKIISMKRLYFNAANGQESVRKLCLRESPIDHVTLRKHFALAATSAILKYVEIAHCVAYEKESLNIRYESAAETVAIDVETAKRLELVKGTGKMVNPDKHSLFGVLDCTVTLGGKRRLRADILQPFTNLAAITERQNNVTLLVENKTFLTALHKSLSHFSQIERLLWLCRKTPDLKHEKKANEAFTSYILLLKSALENIPDLNDVLNESQEEYFVKIKQTLQDQRFQGLSQIINEKIHEDARPGRNYQQSAMNRCFLLKDNVNSLLDVARVTYSKLVDEVREHIANLAEEYGLPLKMVQTVAYGFHAQFTTGARLNPDVPPIFTEVRYQGNTCHLCTDKMYYLNVRIRRIVEEIQLISNVVLMDLMKDIRPMVSCVCSLCEIISELDVLCCLAKISSSKDYVRPTFGRILDVQAGRHPILDYEEPTKPIPNNILAKKLKNFNIITGPNMGGKTVYVLQIALLQIMAQIGCYVPAASAQFRLADMVFVRKSSLESIEMRASSLNLELKELTYAMKFSTGSSLIIIDEICAGTDFQGGTALAWAICEEFLKKPAFTFLTTHLHYLTNMDQIFPNVTNYHMEAIDLSKDSPYEPLAYTYRLQSGVTQIANYGLKLILSTNLPESVKNYCLTVAERLCQKRANTLAAAVNLQKNVMPAVVKTEKLEKIFLDLYSATNSDSFNLELVQTVQNLVISEILTDSEDDEDGTASGKGMTSVTSVSVSSKIPESTISDPLNSVNSPLNSTVQ